MTEVHVAVQEQEKRTQIGADFHRLNLRASAESAFKLLKFHFLFAGVLLVILWSARLANAQSEPVTVGYRDFRYGSEPLAEITGEKTESKLWWNDGFWWGSLWGPSTDRYTIQRFNVTTQSWISTGTPIDDRSDSKADVLWDGLHLYVVSHVYALSGGPASSADAGRLYRYSYNSVSKSYSLNTGFPVTVNGSISESLVLDKDSTGQLWITWVENGKVMVNRTIGNDQTWGAPFILPVQGNDVNPDDVSSVVAFGSGALPGGNKIGIMWSNQNDRITYFAVHRDSDADAVWQPREQALADPSLGQVSDDHINLKMACDGSGSVYAIAKTGLNGGESPLFYILRRDPTGVWTRHVAAKRSEEHTRPLMLIDRENQKLYIFLRSMKTGPAIIYMKRASLSTLQFPEGLGIPFIENRRDDRVNNPTSTKQCVDGNTGLLVLASEKDTRYYLHNYLDLSGKPNVLFFDPTEGVESGEVTITGINFTGAAAVAFNGKAAANFTVDSDTQIRARVPGGATTGKISISNADGTGLSANSFVVLRAPTIISFAPTSGPVGTEVTISGSNFTGTTGVAFNGTATSGFIVDSDTQIRANVPVGATTGEISVTNPVGSDFSPSDFIVRQPPTISSFTPASGPVGAEVTIVGSNFTGVTNVTFNGPPPVGASFTVISSTQLRAIVPPGATTGKISLTNADGIGVSATNFTVIKSPVITAFAPSRGPVGTEVTISGINFTGATAVAFNGTSAINFTVDSDTRLRAKVPAGSTTGKIEVTNSFGAGSSANNFTVVQPPIITSFTPASAPVRTEATIAGSNFIDVTGVAFNGTPASNFTVNSDTQLRAEIPEGATTGKIRITNSAGSGSSANNFTVTQPPAITAFTPSSGGVGAEVTINGKKFTGVTTVAFNGIAASTFTVDSDAQLRANVPAGATTGKISVTNAEGTGLSVSDFNLTVRFSFAPLYDAYVRLSSPVQSYPSTSTLLQRVTSGEVIHTYLKFNVTGLNGPVVSAKLRLYVTNASNDGGAVYAVSNNYKGSTTPWTENGLSWDYAPAISPDGPGLSTVPPGGMNAGSWIELDVTPAIWEDGTYSFGLKNTSSDAAGYSSKEGGNAPELVVMVGTGSTIASTFAPLSDAYVRFSSPAQSYPSTPALLQRVSSGEMIRTYLKFNVTGLRGSVESAKLRLYVTNASDDGGSVYVVSNNHAGSATAWTESDLTWNNAPAIGGTALSTVGAVSVDQWIELDVTSAISGNGIYSFGLKNASLDVVNYSSKEGGNAPELVIVTGTGLAPGPTITAFSPSDGYAGITVTITGMHLDGTIEVAFNGGAAGATATTFTVDSPAQIRAEVPAGASTGRIRVTTSAGNALSADDFTVIPLAGPPVFTPLYDAYVRFSSPAQSYPSTPALLQRVTADEVIHTYLKFNVTGLSEPVTSATLRLYVTNASDDGGSVYVVSNNHAGSPDGSGWTENDLTWNNAPAIGGTPLRTVGAVGVDQWLELDVTPAISGNGIYSFGLKNTSSNVVGYSSKEGTNAPELVIRTASNSPKARAMTVAEERLIPPEQIDLSPNYPNPFNAHTTIRYALPEATKVRLLIFNALGHLVRQLVDEIQPAGYKQTLWDGKDDRGNEVASGVYRICLELGQRQLTRQITLLK